MKLSIDAMGGDNAPEAIVAGACDALKKFNTIEKVYLVGDREKIKPLIDEGVKDRIEIIHTDEIIN